MSVVERALSRQRGAPGGGEVPDAAVVAMAWSVMAGTIHLVVAPGHLAEAWYLGAFFVIVGVGQLVLAALLRNPLPVPVLVGAVLAHVAVMGLYVASRTVDLWFLPPHGHQTEHLPVAGGIGNGIPVHPGDRIEPVGPLDLACLLAELVVVVALLSLMPSRPRARVTSLVTSLSVVGTVALLATRV